MGKFAELAYRFARLGGKISEVLEGENFFFNYQIYYPHQNYKIKILGSYFFLCKLKWGIFFLTYFFIQLSIKILLYQYRGHTFIMEM